MFFSAQKNKCCSLDFHQDHNIYYRAKKPNTIYVRLIILMERKTRFELATLALARRCSTTELFPHTIQINGGVGGVRTHARLRA